MKLVIKIGGHLLFPSITSENIIRYSSVIRKLVEGGHLVQVVVGGGAPARQYIEVARTIGVEEASCDSIGIAISRINAYLLSKSLKDVICPIVPKTFEELNYLIAMGKSLVLGGLQPGQSTNAVAALLAEIIKADMLIVATDVDGIYTEDPKKSSTAKKIDEILVTDLISLVASSEARAGEYRLFDLVALKIIERAGVLTVVIDGRLPENIFRVIAGEKIGTRIIPKGGLRHVV